MRVCLDSLLLQDRPGHNHNQLAGWAMTPERMCSPCEANVHNKHNIPLSGFKRRTRK